MDSKEISNFRNTLRKFERLTNSQVNTCCAGVTFAQCTTLLEIGNYKQISTGDLAEVLALDKSTISRTVDALVKKQLVNREENSKDRRYNTLSLTPEGKDLYLSINSESDKYYLQMFENIPESLHKRVNEDITLIVKALEKVRRTDSNTID